VRRCAARFRPASLAQLPASRASRPLPPRVRLLVVLLLSPSLPAFPASGLLPLVSAARAQAPGTPPGSRVTSATVPWPAEPNSLPSSERPVDSIGQVDSASAQRAAGPAALSPAAAEKERELRELRARIAETRARATALADDEKGQVARLHALEREADYTATLLGKLADKQSSLETRADSLQGEIGVTQSRLADRRAHLAQRLRQMYKQGRHHTLALMLTSATLDELAARMKAQTEISRAEQRLIDDVVHTQWQLRDRRLQLDRSLAEVYRTRSEVEDRKLELQGLQDERREAVELVRRERQHFESSVTELEEAARAMESLVSELQRRREESGTPAPSTHFSVQQGRLPWPVLGKIIKPFGKSVHPQFKTVVMNKGINISSAAGTPITAVAQGVVEYVDWLPGYGKCIIVNHGDGYYTLYAHASNIFFSPGAQVQRGEVIGEVGDTGSLNGSQLYFEIRQGKQALDPAAWLLGTGQARTP
jgi:septal ring factor EnvC (AmiA/AmiB activator)